MILIENRKGEVMKHLIEKASWSANLFLKMLQK